MAKPRQLKPWPELTGLLPLLKADEPKLRATEVGHLDLENVFEVDSLGLVIYLAKLRQFLSNDSPELFLSLPLHPTAAVRLEDLNFLNFLNTFGNIKQYEDLFSSEKSANAEDLKKNDASILEEIVHVKAVGFAKREAELLRVKRLIKGFLNRDESGSFAHQQIMVVLLELVKNTLDHSNCDAFLGLQITDSRFCFNYADTGSGIVSSVRKFFGSEASKLISEGDLADASRIGRLSEKGAFADFIQWALKPGNSTKIGNGVNFGFGLMMITQASKNCGMRLAVRDADTYLILTHSALNSHNPVDVVSHSFLRQRGVTTSAPPLLLFHGVLDFSVS